MNRQFEAAERPRLTMGVPTHDRPDLLPRALDSAFRQTVPVQVIVSDDFDPLRTERLLRERYPDRLESGRLRVLGVEAQGLWHNWDACARACDTDYFLWLQDDDIVQEYTAARVIEGLDQFKDADLWMAPNKLGLDADHIWWNNGNGPWVPLHRLGLVESWECEILAPTCYFASWALSPGVAFRTGERFTRALGAMPADCEIFAERLILVHMGGRFVADPYVAGVWIQHAGNYSRKLYGRQPAQTKILFRELDRAMDALGDRWRPILACWCRYQHPNWLVGWMQELDHAEREGGRSKYGDAIREVVWGSLEGRIEWIPRYTWWRRWINRAVEVLRWRPLRLETASRR